MCAKRCAKVLTGAARRPIDRSRSFTPNHPVFANLPSLADKTAKFVFTDDERDERGKRQDLSLRIDRTTSIHGRQHILKPFHFFECAARSQHNAT